MNDDYAHLPYDMNGHVALVTGANHGIGAATAKALASCGASVWNPRDTLPESEVNS